MARALAIKETFDYILIPTEPVGILIVGFHRGEILMLKRWLHKKHDDHHKHEIHCTSLCCARSGQCARVLDLVNDCDEAARLRDLGLHEGATVTVLRHGDPMVIRVDDTRFGLGRKAAEKVLCELL